MGILVTTQGERREIKPKNGRDFQLQELYDLLGCTSVSIVPTHEGSMVCDEDAHCKAVKPPYNQLATTLYWESGGRFGHLILGDVLLCEGGEIQ